MVAMVLTATAGGLLALQIVPLQQQALTAPHDGAQLRRLGMVTGVFNLLWVVVAHAQASGASTTSTTPNLVEPLGRPAAETQTLAGLAAKRCPTGSERPGGAPLSSNRYASYLLARYSCN